MSTALRIHQALPPALLWVATVLLAACGGGGLMAEKITSMFAGVIWPRSSPPGFALELAIT
jgi:hypothetical protein